MTIEEINKKIAIIINRNGMGEAPQELSQVLIKNYLSLLISEEKYPTYICFYGDGVKLACNDSNVIEELKSLEKMGSKIVICKTCLIFNNLLSDVQVGTIGTMLDIIDIQQNCTKLINL